VLNSRFMLRVDTIDDDTVVDFCHLKLNTGKLKHENIIIILKICVIIIEDIIVFVKIDDVSRINYEQNFQSNRVIDYVM
jgi:hypothetical protein